MKKKVLFVIERLCGGGAERVLSNIVTHFPEDWYIDILVDDESLIEYPYKGNILSLSLPERNITICYIRSMIKRTLYLKKIKRSNRYDACISFLDGANISNVFSGNRHCKSVVSIHSYIMPKQSGLYHRVRGLFLTKIVLSNADIIVAVSEEIASNLVQRLKIPEKKVRTIANGYDREWIKKRMEKYPQNNVITESFFTGNCKVIITVGRIVEPKGQWHLIRAFSDVIKRESQVVLLILGSGPLKEYLAELIYMYGLKDKIILVGHSDNPFWFYKNADIFVLPSLWEGYPSVLVEAACCGVPCIATDVHSGAREILAPELNVMGHRVREISEEEYGILIPACSGKMYRNCEPLELEEQKMAEAIVMLLRNDKKREYYKKKSIERSKELDINSMVHKWINVILEKEK